MSPVQASGYYILPSPGIHPLVKANLPRSPFQRTGKLFFSIRNATLNVIKLEKKNHTKVKVQATAKTQYQIFGGSHCKRQFLGLGSRGGQDPPSSHVHHIREGLQPMVTGCVALQDAAAETMVLPGSPTTHHCP